MFDFCYANNNVGGINAMAKCFFGKNMSGTNIGGINAAGTGVIGTKRI